MSKPLDSKSGELIHLADHPLAKKRSGLNNRQSKNPNTKRIQNENQHGKPGSRRILIVEDDRSTRQTIFEFLDASGYECNGACSAEEAIERYRYQNKESIWTNLSRRSVPE